MLSLSLAVLSLNQNSELLATDKLMVKFYLPNCPACKTFAPVYEEIERGIPDLKFYEFDCTMDYDFCLQNKVKGFPHIRLYLGEGRYVQYRNVKVADALAFWIKQNLE